MFGKNLPAALLTIAGLALASDARSFDGLLAAATTATGAAPPVATTATGTAPPVATTATGAAPPAATTGTGTAPPVATTATGTAPPAATTAGATQPAVGRRTQQRGDDLPATVATSVVQVRAWKGEKLQTVVSGFVVNDRKAVLTSGHALRKAGRITVTFAAGSTEIAARLVWRDDATDSALLDAPGLAAAPVVFAANGLAGGRRVAAVWRRQADGELQIARGALGAAATTGRQAASYRHNAMITAAGYGSPLLDECGRVAGINRKDPEGALFFWSTRAKDPDGVVHAVSSPDLLALLRGKGVPHNAETTACTPREQAARTAQAEAETRAAEAAAAQAEAEARAAEAAEAAGQAREAAEEAQRRADLSEAEKAELRRQAEEKQRAAEEAEARVQELAQAEAEARQDAEQKRKYLYIGGIVAAVLALVVLFLFIWRSRVARRRLAGAEEARRKAEAPPNPDSRPGWSFGAGGGEGSFYISREVLEAAGQGVRIGRNPDSCDYAINAPEVSREHCRVFLDNGRLMLEDLKSANGTRIGARQLEAYTPDEIRDGDRITLGHLVFEVKHVAG